MGLLGKSRRIVGLKKKAFISLLLCSMFILLLLVFVVDLDVDLEEKNRQVLQRFNQRRLLLLQACNNHIKMEHNRWSSLGSELVRLRSRSRWLELCVPHKVGSHSWGRLARALDVLGHPEDLEEVQMFRAVVVRHPLERLVSVYRMIFEDWCDKDKFLARMWPGKLCNVQHLRRLDADGGGAEADGGGGGGGGGNPNVLSTMAKALERHVRANDNLAWHMWQKYRPHQTLVNPRSQMKFTFKEFIRLVINGTRELDARLFTEAQALTVHWLPYTSECAFCSPHLVPDFVLHMETLKEDTDAMFKLINFSQPVLPHTHNQKGGHSSRVASKYYEQLDTEQIKLLYELYKDDHLIFGYTPNRYLAMAKDGSH